MRFSLFTALRSHFVSGMMTVGLLLATTATAGMALPAVDESNDPAMPSNDQIELIELEPQVDVPRGGEVTEPMLRDLMAAAEPLPWTDPWMMHWTDDPWYAGSFQTPEGRYEFVLHSGDALTLTAPDGRKALFAYRIPEELVVFSRELEDGRELVVTRRPASLELLPEFNQLLRPPPQGHFLVESTGISEIRVQIRDASSDDSLLVHSHLIGEYGHRISYAVYDARLEGGHLALLSQKPPGGDFYLKLISLRGGPSQTLRFRGWDERHAARTWIGAQWLEMRLAGSLAENDLGIEIVGR